MTCARQHYPVTLVGVTTLILLAMTCRDVQGQTKPQEASNSGITKFDFCSLGTHIDRVFE